MMKRLVCLTTLIGLLLSLCACGNGSRQPQSAQTTPTHEISDDETNTPVTDLEMVLLNHVSFNDEIENTDNLNELVDDKYSALISGSELDGYSVKDFDHGDPTGFRAANFKKGNSIVLVYCGTEDFADYLSDIAAGAVDSSSQDDQAKQFAKDNAKLYPDCDIYITGYSMGGRLAYLGAEAIAEEEAGDTTRIKRVVTYNGLGVKHPQDVESHLSPLSRNEIVNYIVIGDDISDDWIKKDFYMQHAGIEKKYACTNPYDLGYPKLIFDLGVDIDLTKHDLYTFIDILGGKNANVIRTDEEPAAAPTDYTDAYRSYLDLLAENKVQIDAYKWQRGYYSGQITEEQTPRPVVLADICGDETPELIFCTANMANGIGSASLSIYTYRNNQADRIYFREYIDTLVAGGNHYILFRQRGDKSLYLYESTGDDWWEDTYSVFAETGDGLILNEIYQYNISYEYDSSGERTDKKEFTKNGAQAISESEYYEAVDSLWGNMSALLMYNKQFEPMSDTVDKFISKNGCPAMTCDEAIRFLREKLGDVAEGVSSDWRDAYREFLIYKQFLNSDEYVFFPFASSETDINTIRIGMKDISGDGIPELFMSNEGEAEAIYTNYVFTVKDGNVIYLGDAGSRNAWLEVDLSGRYPGVFCFFGSWGVYSCEYYTVNEEELASELVYIVATDMAISENYVSGEISESGYSEVFGSINYIKFTDDDDLYECGTLAVAPEKRFTTDAPNPSILKYFSLQQISDIGWDIFIENTVVY